jgi:methylenetetrahydrofolate reductase (NADPH)
MKADRPIFSLEFFPPKSPEETADLYATLEEIRALNPGYITVTYGAGGGTRDKTLEIVERAKHEIGLESAAHLTCIGHSKSEIKEILDNLARFRVENVVALRGDPPNGDSHFIPHPAGFRHASELTAFIRDNYPFCIAVAGYPEGHTEASDKETDWTHLEEKVRAGADLVITQLFFENSYFYEFEERMRQKGTTVPIVPGIMPITNFHQLLKLTRFCGASLPEKVVNDLEAIKTDHEAVQKYGIAYATEQCKDLLAHGVPAIHFYTLNKSRATREIIRNLEANGTTSSGGLR